MEVVKITPERVQHTLERTVDVLVPLTAEKIVEVLQERISECIGRTGLRCASGANSRTQTVEVVMLTPQERVRHRTVEQIVDVPVVTHGHPHDPEGTANR